MKELFLILLFSEWVQLTPIPVDLWGISTFAPEDPVSAITPGAAVHIDLAESVPEAAIRSAGLRESIDLLRRRIPLESVQGFLLTDAGEQIQLDQKSFSPENDKAWLVLGSKAGVPTGVDFVEVTVTSSTQIHDALVYWKNWSE
jgi:hypothetical protein